MVDFPGALWPASFRGVPFHVEREGHGGGRRIVVHEFPMRDTPFLEDLGECKREFPVTAYVASDSTLAQASALEKVLRAAGAGTLVLPGRGPVTARVKNFERRLERDSLGYIGFDVHFLAEGAASAFIGVTALASAVHAAGDLLAQVAGGLVSRLRLAGLPGGVTLAAQDRAETAVAAIEAMRVSETLDPAASATLRDTLGALYGDVPALIARDSGGDVDFGDRLVTAARDLAGAMDPPRAVAVFGQALDGMDLAPVPAGLTPIAAAQADNARLLDRVARAGWLAAYADALALADFASRAEGVTARADAATRFGTVLAECLDGSDIEIASATDALRGRVVEYLSSAIADLRPVVTVTSTASMPALWWAQRLYGSADAALDLVNRNSVHHAGFMPLRFEALRA